MDLSVVCPVFNSDPALLRAAARSVLSAGDSRGVAALILVDDASTDRSTLDTLQSMQSEPRVRVFRQARNTGPASARNRGIAEARTEWIGFLDADDLWLPGRLEATVALAGTAQPNWIGGRHVSLHRDGSLHREPGIADAMARAGRPSDRADVYRGPDLTRQLIANFWMHLGAVLVKRDVALRIGGFAEGLRYYEDFLFLAKLSVVEPLHLLDAEVYAWRRTGTGLTASPARLSPDSMRMHSLAAADPLLHGFRRELRWARYSARKGLALNNLLAGHRIRALLLALDTYRMDPRELGDLATFLRMWIGGGAGPAQRLRYSHAEIFSSQDSR
ncbi:glycosyltransferase family 2 protein [Roseomonas populi]|uniref:Glycosyltransferase family 2 protein n=1 Tax=Roseomonas populi TaxID=3121582 RepID=A0ABT1XDR1_9PROT|nr:glycosyltransferase family 2 protein [Roseomonas pecuniae]MCR0985114.1 glycosyltransferase family 2 protein [Roseomonas pecuniae]